MKCVAKFLCKCHSMYFNMSVFPLGEILTKFYKLIVEVRYCCFKRCWHILVEYWALVELWLYELARTWLKLSWVWCPCPLYQFIMSSSWCNYHVRDGPLNYICQHSLNISKIMQKTFCKYYVTGSAPASISWCGTFYFLRYLQCFSKKIYLCSFMFSCLTVSL